MLQAMSAACGGSVHRLVLSDAPNLPTSDHNSQLFKTLFPALKSLLWVSPHSHYLWFSVTALITSCAVQMDDAERFGDSCLRLAAECSATLTELDLLPCTPLSFSNSALLEVSPLHCLASFPQIVSLVPVCSVALRAASILCASPPHRYDTHRRVERRRICAGPQLYWIVM